MLFFIDHCDICMLNKRQNLIPTLNPIRSKYSLERFQIDMIDMRHDPSGNWCCVAHVVDHFSYSYSHNHILWPKVQKCMVEVAQSLKTHVFAYFGLPSIFQSGNGLEFKNSQ